MCMLASLKSVEQELCDQLCTTPCYIPTGSIPSEEQLEQLKVLLIFIFVICICKFTGQSLP